MYIFFNYRFILLFCEDSKIYSYYHNHMDAHCEYLSKFYIFAEQETQKQHDINPYSNQEFQLQQTH